MQKQQKTTDLHAYFSELYPDEPQLAADAAVANELLGWTPPGEAPPPRDLPTGAPAATARRSRIDWGRAARLLASGCSIEDAARQLRCDPQAIRRNLRRSRRFRLRIEGEHAHGRLMAQLRFGALGDYAISHLKLHSDNPRLLQWLGDRIGLGELASGKTAGHSLALRFQAALRPGQRMPSEDEEAERVIGEAELERMLRETREWHETRDAYDRAMAEKKAFEQAQRGEE